MTPFEKLCKNLEAKIVAAYTEGVTQDEAERLAGEFLGAQLAVSEQLKICDLDARMKKNGAKAVRAAIYLREATKGDKKPSDVMLQALVDTDPVAQGEQDGYDSAQAESDALDRHYNIFREAHTFFRGVSRGRYDGG